MREECVCSENFAWFPDDLACKVDCTLFDGTG